MPLWYQNKVDELNCFNLSKGQKMAWVSNQRKQQMIIKNLLEKNQCLVEKVKDNSIIKMLLAMLYLGEGCKWKSHKGMILGSSDPNIIQLYLQLLHLCYGLKPEQMKCRVSYRADQNIRLLETYWSKITGIPLNNFYKTKADPRTIGKPTKKKDYKGVCVINGGGTAIQRELEIIPNIILRGIMGM